MIGWIIVGYSDSKKIIEYFSGNYATKIFKIRYVTTRTYL